EAAIAEPSTLSAARRCTADGCATATDRARSRTRQDATADRPAAEIEEAALRIIKVSGHTRRCGRSHGCRLRLVNRSAVGILWPNAKPIVERRQRAIARLRERRVAINGIVVLLHADLLSILSSRSLGIGGRHCASCGNTCADDCAANGGCG